MIQKTKVGKGCEKVKWFELRTEYNGWIPFVTNINLRNIITFTAKLATRKRSLVIRKLSNYNMFTIRSELHYVTNFMKQSSSSEANTTDNYSRNFPHFIEL